MALLTNTARRTSAGLESEAMKSKAIILWIAVYLMLSAVGWGLGYLTMKAAATAACGV